jgi:hypothetical protein
MLTTSTDANFNTIAHFSGSSAVAQSDTANRHFGLFGMGTKPQVLAKVWTYATAPFRVSVPSLNFSYLYEPASLQMVVTAENLGSDTVTLTESGYLIFPTELPVDDLNRNILPPSAFLSLASLNGQYLSGQEQSTIIDDVTSSDFFLDYGTVAFSGASSGNPYNTIGGEWSEVSAAAAAAAEPGSIQLLGMGAFAILLFALARHDMFAIAWRVGSCRARYLVKAAAGILVFWIAMPACGDVFVLPILPGGANTAPRVRMTVNVAGMDQSFNLVIDTGDEIAMDGGFYVNNRTTDGNNVAGRLGMGAGGAAGAIDGAGAPPGGAASRTGVPLPAGLHFANPPNIPGGQATAAPALPAASTVASLPAGDDALIGSQFLSNYQYGRMDGPSGSFFYLAAKAEGASAVHAAISIASFLSAAPISLGPDGRPIGSASKPITPTPGVVTPPGTVAMDGGFNLDLSLLYPATGTNASGSFIIKTGFDRTLISQSLATQLGINVASLPTASTDINFDTFSIPVVEIDANVFAGQASYLLDAGVLPDSLNPFDENFLGDDLLSKFQYHEVDTNTDLSGGTFFALPTPEPAIMGLCLLGTCVIGLTGVRPKIRGGVLLACKAEELKGN